MIEAKKKYTGFTLIEMAVVLFVISFLILLFIPNLSKQRSSIAEKGDKAVLQVVDNQIEMYRLNNEGELSDDAIVEALKKDNQINEEQYKTFKEKRK